MPSKELAARIGARWPLAPLQPDYRGEVAERYAFADGQGEVGFISSVSQPFCGDCSRARLSSDGMLYTCLFATHGTSLRDALRGGASDDALLELMRSVWLRRADRYSELRAQLRASSPRGAQGRNVLHRWLMARRSLTHLDARNRPAMVDVGAKDVTRRAAVAEARVRLPPAVARALTASGHRTSKGPVFDTAIVAGVMAAKRTHELIPFCHPLGLEDCQVRHRAQRGGEIHIRCETAVHHRTGVEMEALTGATVAALTIYDMCKALSHDIEIVSVRLLAKTGGRRTVRRADG